MYLLMDNYYCHSNQFICLFWLLTKVVNNKLYVAVVQVGGKVSSQNVLLFLWQMPVSIREYDGCFLFVPMIDKELHLILSVFINYPSLKLPKCSVFMLFHFFGS